MSAPEVTFVLDAVESIATEIDVAFGTVQDVADGIAPVRRLDRDESTILEGDIRTRKGELQASNYIGASLAERPAAPVGTEYDNRVEAVVSMRIEGLHYSEWGHIDPVSAEGIPFDELIDAVRDALFEVRSYPDVGRADTSYQTLFVENDTNRSSDYRDFYDYRLDCRFVGYEELP